jgi:hypothetical protein
MKFLALKFSRHNEELLTEENMLLLIMLIGIERAVDFIYDGRSFQRMLRLG